MTSWKFYLFYNHCQLDHCSKNHHLCCSKLILHPLLPIVSQCFNPNSSLRNPLFSPSKSQVLSQKSNSSPQKSPKSNNLAPKKPSAPTPSGVSELGNPTRWPPWHRPLPVASLRPFEQNAGARFFWWRSSTKIGRYRDFRIQIIQQFLVVTDLPTRYHRDMIKIKYDYNQ